MTLSELPPWASEMLASARVGRLALIDSEDHPRALPVTYAIAEDAIWSAIDRKPKRTSTPARLRWLRQRPEAALVVDHYSDDWLQLRWVQVLGRVTLLEAGEAEVGLEALARKYEPYRVHPPPGPVLRLEPERTIHWRAA